MTLLRDTDATERVDKTRLDDSAEVIRYRNSVLTVHDASQVESDHSTDHGTIALSWEKVQTLTKIVQKASGDSTDNTVGNIDIGEQFNLGNNHTGANAVFERRMESEFSLSAGDNTSDDSDLCVLTLSETQELYDYAVQTGYDDLCDTDGMEHKFGPDIYDVGKGKQDSSGNIVKKGRYSVAKGDTVNTSEMYEFQPHNCLSEDKWYALRFGPTYRRDGTTTTRSGNVVIHTLGASPFEGKQEAVEYLREELSLRREFDGRQNYRQSTSNVDFSHPGR